MAQGTAVGKSWGQRVWRRKLVLPAEHGSWSWFFVSFLVGVGIAGQWNTAVTWVLVGGLAVFLGRQPATIWLKAHTGKARRSDKMPAFFWVITLGSLALLALVGLLWQGHVAVLWLLLPAFLLSLVYVLIGRRGNAGIRTLWLELLGAAGLALLSPAVLIVVAGKIQPDAWFLWGIMAMLNMLGAMYVRLKIADTHQRTVSRLAVLGGHTLGFLIVVAATRFGWIANWVWLPFAGILLRAIWVYPQPRPIANIKKFGFAEIGVEFLSGLLVVLATIWA